MFETNDSEILERAYRWGIKTARKATCPKEQYMSERANIIRAIDKALVVSRDIYFTELEKQSILRKCKKAFNHYCTFIKGNPDAGTEQLLQRKEELLSLIISLEVPCISRFRARLEEDNYLDLDEIFSKHRYLSELMKEPITLLLEKAIEDTEIRAIKKYKIFYMTKMGKRYHDRNCVCCRGKIVCADNEFNLVNEGIKPCRCIKKAYERAEYIGLKKELEEKYITAFVDESRKRNPGYKISEDMENLQNTASIILCKGKLRGEEDITSENTIGKYIHVTENTDKLENTTLEAIGITMLKASLMGLNKRLLIYTDNQGACSKWRDCKSLEFLSRGFVGVSVKFIKREKNTVADGLLRQNTILQLPRDKMNDVITAYLQRDAMGIKPREMIYAELEKSRSCYEKGEYKDFDDALDEIEKKYDL